ncbi:MAG: SpoIIE family protein phosphatase [Verrucomicrobia bacterium]|nr:SpoIIE family protein phosphatase [Verrucomicrobiota bacterium]
MEDKGVSSEHVPSGDASRGIGFLQEACPQFLERVAVRRGEVLFRAGDAADALYLVESGEMAVLLEVTPGERTEARRLGVGQLLGEMALYRAQLRIATVEAVADSVLWRLTAARLRTLETEHPELALALHRQAAVLLSERVAFGNLELKEPLVRLAHALRGLAAGDFAPEAWDHPGVADAARRGDEVGEVARATSFLVGRLQAYLEELRRATAAREAVESELRIAGEIQNSLLPPPLTPAGRSRVDFAAFIRPAREAGGDLYDGFFLPDGRFLALVGDVSGKGVSAALFMALAATALRTLSGRVADPGELLGQVNRLLCERNATLQFVTVCALMLEPDSGRLAWANAGHPPPALRHRGGDVEWLDGPRSPPLGVFEEASYPTWHRTLDPGDAVVVFSDGVSEAMDPLGTLLGVDAVAACLSYGALGAAADLVARVVAAVDAHQAAAPQADDITLVALRLPARPAGP